MFKGKNIVITGAAQGIGRCIAEEFQRNGANIYSIDRKPKAWMLGDISEKAVLEDFAKRVIESCGTIDVLVNNAMTMMGGLNSCSWEDFDYALRTGVTAPFYLCRLFRDAFSKGASVINISSSRDRMSQPNTESYTAAKGGISALTHALAVSLAGKVRVNSISPGWIDTMSIQHTEEDEGQHPAGRVGHPLDVAHMVLYLCSDKAGFITGENICIDGGMTRQMIYHNDFGWTYKTV